MKLQSAGENLLPAIAYGDACGLPFEAQPAQPLGALSALPSISHNEFLAIPEEMKGNRGIWSDDTHLSLATALSLILSGRFDLDNQAMYHVNALEHVKGANYEADLMPPIVTDSRSNGFGRSTTRSIIRLAEGIDPLEAGEVGGSGNGVLMKMAPLAYWHYANNISPKQSNDEIIAYTRMTHNSPEAVVSSLVHRDVIHHLLSVDSATAPQNYAGPRSLYRAAVKQAERWEHSFDHEGKTSKVLRRLNKKYLDDDREPILNAIEGKKGGGFYAPETLLMAYGSIAIESKFPDCVYRAVELGGDTDSVGSIVAGMAVAYHGKLDFPNDVEQVFAIDRLRRVSKDLAKTVLEGRK